MPIFEFKGQVWHLQKNPLRGLDMASVIPLKSVFPTQIRFETIIVPY